MIIVEKACFCHLTAFINKLNNQKDFFLNCDLGNINIILVDYGENEYDNPDHLFNVLISFFE